MEENSLILCDTNIIINFYKEDLATLKQLKTIGPDHIARISHQAPIHRGHQQGKDKIAEETSRKRSGLLSTLI